jgi:hypothetical protein
MPLHTDLVRTQAVGRRGGTEVPCSEAAEPRQVVHNVLRDLDVLVQQHLLVPRDDAHTAGCLTAHLVHDAAAVSQNLVLSKARGVIKAAWPTSIGGSVFHVLK